MTLTPAHTRSFKRSQATRSLAVLAGLLFLLGCAPPPRVGPERPFNGERAFRLAAAQMALGPRVPGSEAHTQAGDLIGSELAAAGWTVRFQPFEHNGVRLRNIQGSAGEGKPHLLLGAHYDTRPAADQDPFDPSVPVPGANDGASGVAVLLELADALAAESLTCRVDLVFFDAEDGGDLPGWDWILGSTRYAETLQERPDAVVIVDMVGDRDLQLYLERSSDQALAAEIWATAAEVGATAFIPEPRYSILDDHTPFLRLGLPAVDIIDFDYPYWHTAEDTLDKISAESLEQVGRTLQAWLGKRCP